MEKSNGCEKEVLSRKKLVGLECKQDVGEERYGGFKDNVQVSGADHRAKIVVDSGGWGSGR